MVFLTLIIAPLESDKDTYFYVYNGLSECVSRGRSNGTVFTLTFPVIKGDTYTIQASSNAIVNYCYFYKLF